MAHADLGRNVSRETIAKLEAFADLVQRWNRKINLVADARPEILWKRHIADSAQLLDHLPAGARSWLDLGSGAGFPALVCAICLSGQPPAPHVTLVESDQRKAAFLREAIRTAGIPATVQNSRIEDLPPQPFDIVTARALAPLPQLLEHAARFRHQNTVLLFPKGRQTESELTAASAAWHIEYDRIPSRTDSEGTILKIREFARHP